MRKGVKISLWTLGGLVALLCLVVLTVVLALFYINPIAKYAIRYFDEHSDGPVIVVNNLDIHPLQGEVTLWGVRYSNKKKKSVTFQLDTLYTQVELRPLLQKKLTVTHLHVSGFDGRFIRYKKRYLLRKAMLKGKELARKAEEGGWQVRMQDVVVRDGHVFFRDKVGRHDWEFLHINGNFPRFYVENTLSEGEATCSLPNLGGTVKAHLHYNVGTTSYRTHVMLGCVVVDQFHDFYRRSTPVLSTGALLTADLMAWGRLEQMTASNASGSVGLSHLDLRMKNKPRVLVDSMDASGISVSLSRKCYGVDLMNLRGVGTSLHLDGRAFGLRRFHIQLRDMSYVDRMFTLDSYRIKDGTLVFHDSTLRSPFNFTLSHINLYGKNFSPKGVNSAFLKARLPHGGQLQLRWRGGLNVRKDKEYVTMAVTDLQLEDINPYIQYYMARTVSSGVLSVVDTTRIDAGRLNSMNHVSILDLKISKRDKNEEAKFKKVPLRLYAFLLRDLDKELHFDLPITGTLDHPQISLHEAVKQAERNVLTRILKGPFVYLKRLFTRHKDKKQKQKK